MNKSIECFKNIAKKQKLIDLESKNSMVYALYCKELHNNFNFDSFGNETYKLVYIGTTTNWNKRKKDHLSGNNIYSSSPSTFSFSIASLKNFKTKNSLVSWIEKNVYVIPFESENPKKLKIDLIDVFIPPLNIGNNNKNKFKSTLSLNIEQKNIEYSFNLESKIFRFRKMYF